MKKILFITISALIFSLFNSCTKEDVVVNNSNENNLKSITSAPSIPSNPLNPYDYAGVWHYDILEKTKWYLTEYLSPIDYLYADYEYSKRACTDILGRRVYTGELLTIDEINRIIGDSRYRYSNIISNSGLSKAHKAKLQDLMDALFKILSKDMPISEYYRLIIKTIADFESLIPVPAISDPGAAESRLTQEYRVLLVMCSIARYSAYYWFGNINPNDVNGGISAANYTYASIAGAIATFMQTGMMNYDVRITCSASLTGAVAGF